MDDPEQILLVPFTIASGQSQSAAVDVDGYGLLRLYTPAAVDSAPAMTMLMSTTLGGTYVPFYDDAGEYSVPNFAVSRCLWFDPSKFVGVRFVRFRLGTAASPVVATADRIFSLECRSL